MKVPQEIRASVDLEVELLNLEAHIDPAQPESGGGVRVLGYGEISTALVLDARPDLVCKRMAGFVSDAEAEQYASALGDYLAELRGHGVAVADTQLALIRSQQGLPIAYLVQPLLPPAGLASNLLRDSPLEHVLLAVSAVLKTVQQLLESNARRTDGREVAIDAQLSNWWFADGRLDNPTLLDVGTPFMRRDGVDECGTEFFLAPVPWVLRWYYRRTRAVQRYIDDYFIPRALALDLLGNFHKEGRPERIAAVLPVVNDWLTGTMGERAGISEKEVDDYYRRDAADLELYLRVRRVDRWLKKRVFRQQYPFILPGPIQR